jgi:hypothetical protein
MPAHAPTSRWYLPILAVPILAMVSCSLTGLSATPTLPVSSSNIALNPSGTLRAVANPDSYSVEEAWTSTTI